MCKSKLTSQLLVVYWKEGNAQCERESKRLCIQLRNQLQFSKKYTNNFSQRANNNLKDKTFT